MQQYPTCVRWLLGVALALAPAEAIAQQQAAPVEAKPKLVGIVIITHGQLGLQFRNIAEFVVGKQVGIATVGVGPEDNIEERRNTLIERLAEVDAGCGVLIMSDMFGGTPSNLAISVMKPGKVEVLAGMSLPSLIKAISMRGNCDLMAVALNAQEAGRRYINLASELLKKAKPEGGATPAP